MAPKNENNVIEVVENMAMQTRSPGEKVQHGADNIAHGEVREGVSEAAQGLQEGASTVASNVKEGAVAAKDTVAEGAYIAKDAATNAAEAGKQEMGPHPLDDFYEGASKVGSTLYTGASTVADALSEATRAAADTLGLNETEEERAAREAATETREGAAYVTSRIGDGVHTAASATYRGACTAIEALSNAGSAAKETLGPNAGEEAKDGASDIASTLYNGVSTAGAALINAGSAAAETVGLKEPSPAPSN